MLPSRILVFGGGGGAIFDPGYGGSVDVNATIDPLPTWDAGIPFFDPSFGGGVNVFGTVNPIPTVDPLPRVTYKPRKPPIPNAKPPLSNLLNCISSCMGGTNLIVTATKNDHPKNSTHGRCLASDIRPVPGRSQDFFNCAAKCHAGYGQDEVLHPSPKSTAPHWHIQIPRGKNGGHGALPY